MLNVGKLWSYISFLVKITALSFIVCLPVSGAYIRWLYRQESLQQFKRRTLNIETSFTMFSARRHIKRFRRWSYLTCFLSLSIIFFQKMGRWNVGSFGWNLFTALLNCQESECEQLWRATEPETSFEFCKRVK